MDGGWIKIHRSLLNWEWWDDPVMVKAFLCMLFLCSTQVRRHHGRELAPGQFVTSRQMLAAFIGISEQQVRTVIRRMRQTGEIIVESTKQQTLISIVHWDEYQNRQVPDKPIDGIEFRQPASNQQTTNEQPTSNQQTTNEQPTHLKKELRIEKEEKNTPPDVPPLRGVTAPTGACTRTRKAFRKPTVEEVAAYCTERKNGVDPQQFIDFYESKGWVVGKSPMKDWRAAVRTWECRNGTSITPSSDVVGRGWRRDAKTGVVRGISDEQQIEAFRKESGF